MLTGRRDKMHTLRQEGGLSGFPKMSESPHDAFGTGHASTAISAALGLATARDLQGGSEKIVAVVGDGSMTGGLAFEGLNNAGRAGTDMLVILNDNQMSISKNVGALSRHLNSLRTAGNYTAAKADVKGFLGKIPLVGHGMAAGLEKARDIAKYALLPGTLFEELGFKYIGPVDGHDVHSLMQVLRRVREMKGPVLLHVLTVKGKGHAAAEGAPRAFHGVEASGESKNETSFTNVFSDELCKLAAENDKICAITAAMPDGTGLAEFKRHYPTRFFDVGIAEGHAVTFAAGLAAGGMRPVVAVYSSFLQRGYDNILHDVAAQGLPVVFAIDRAGAVCRDGETHQGVFDMAFLSHIPGLTVLAPNSAAQLRQMLAWAFSQETPVAIRYPRAAAAEVLHDTPGSHTAIVAVGAMMENALAAADILRGKGLQPAVISAPAVCPISSQFVDIIKGYRHVFTVEDGIYTGGYGSRLLRFVPHVHAFSLPDAFIPTGSRTEIFARYSLDSHGIAENIYHTIKGDVSHATNT
jgi:1-deoxy-D-xylulose-5-phosphate synthase